jgi:hypothetical protein
MKEERESKAGQLSKQECKYAGILAKGGKRYSSL